MFPTACSGCRASGPVFCADCSASLDWIETPICITCGDLVKASATLCHRCAQRLPNITNIRGAVWFSGSIQNAIQQLKYSNKFGIAPALADIMASAWSTWQTPIDLVIPVPLHPQREIERNYNQAQLLAEPFARAIGVAVESNALFRRKATRTQVGLGAAARLDNVRDAFSAESTLIQNKRILLVDDVCTTGATMIASAETLQKAGAAEVYGYCLARAQRISAQS